MLLKNNSLVLLAVNSKSTQDWVSYYYTSERLDIAVGTEQIPKMSSERQPLLSIKSQSLSQVPKGICCRPKHLCLSSKAAILIILWTAVVGTAYTPIKDLVATVINNSAYAGTVDVAVLDLIPHVVLAIIMTFYPLSGFIADVCCGRFKTTLMSLRAWDKGINAWYAWIWAEN